MIQHILSNKKGHKTWSIDGGKSAIICYDMDAEALAQVIVFSQNYSQHLCHLAIKIVII